MKQQYDNMEPVAKKQKLAQQRETREAESRCIHDLNHYVTVFKNMIKQGPYYVCSVCHRVLYRKSVVVLVKSKYKIQHLFTDIASFDGKEYICKTCHLKILKGQIP